MTLNENQVEGMANERANEGEKTTHKSGSLALENRINISIRNKSNLNKQLTMYSRVTFDICGNQSIV